MPFSCGNRSQILLQWWHTVVFHFLALSLSLSLPLFLSSLSLSLALWPHLFNAFRPIPSVVITMYQYSVSQATWLGEVHHSQQVCQCQRGWWGKRASCHRSSVITMCLCVSLCVSESTEICIVSNLGKGTMALVFVVFINLHLNRTYLCSCWLNIRDQHVFQCNPDLIGADWT